MWQQTALENGELRTKADQLEELKHRAEGLQARVNELVGQVETSRSTSSEPMPGTLNPKLESRKQTIET